MKKFLFFLLLAGAGAYYYFYVYRPQHGGGAETTAQTAEQPAGGGSGKGRRGETGPVPVVAGVVGKKNVPVYLNGLGNVQAFNTVTIRSRVDGQLVKVGFEEGQEVKAGDLLAQIDPGPYQAALDQAKAKKNQDEAQLTNAKLDDERNVKLLATNSIPTKTVDTQKALVAQLEATVKADDASIEAADVNLKYTTILSPLAGRAGIRLVDQGNIVHAADTTGLVVIAQLHPIAVIFTLPEQNLPSIQQEMTKGTLKVLALGRDEKALANEGTLTVVDNQIDTTTGTIKLKATFTNDKMTLWPGQFVNVRLLLTTQKDAVVVPASVVQRGPEGTYAFVIKDDDTVENRPIKTGIFEGGEAIITDGLKPGDRVVVDGQYRLQVGSHIKDKTKEKKEGSPVVGGGKNRTPAETATSKAKS